MASNKGWDRHYPVLSVAQTGGTFNLAKAQLALVDMNARPTTAGLKIVSDISNAPKTNAYQLRVGKVEIFNNRSQSSKDWSSETFKVTDILNLKVDAPKLGIETDEFILGYNGFDVDSAITLENGDNEEIGLTLSGEVIGMLGYQDSTVEVKTYLTAPNTGAFTNQELIEKAVEQFQNYQLYGNVPLSNYVEVTPINSTVAAVDSSGTEKTFYSLVVKDDGNSNALAAVQSEYNSFEVKRTDYSAGESTYTLIGDPAATLTAGAFVVGQEYEVVATGNTDFTAIGAEASTPGTRFTATGVGTGTGTAIEILVSDLVITRNWKVKGCASCPTGYDTYVDGYIYALKMNDADGDISTAIATALTNEESGSVVKVNFDGLYTTYTVVLTSPIKDADVSALETALGGPVIVELINENAASICASTNTDTYVWAAGDTCYQRTEEYSIIIPDTKCGDSRLAELQAAYPDLTIALDSQAQCQGNYTTEVVTNIVCEECSDAYQDLFSSEAPEAYGVYQWTKAPKTYDENALMGIRFKAKEIILAGTEEYRDEMPNFATSARISVVGGVYRNVNESFNVGTNGRFSGKILNVASEPENWGLNLRQYEDVTKRYEEGVSRHKGNNYAKWVLGEESVLDPTQPYVDYVLTVKLGKYAQSFSGGIEETFYYHFLVVPGKHQEVEDLLNTLALKAGINPVQAYAKDA